jgi:hypothetical protein
MASDAKIASDALILIGLEPIASLSQDVQSARVVRPLYEQLRDELLEEHPWKFARARAALAMLDAKPTFGYARAFQLPTDCLKVISTEPRAGHEIEGGRLLTDLPAVSIKYVRKVTDPAAMPPLFRAALAAKIAGRIAFKFGGQVQVERMEALFERRIAKARAANAFDSESVEPERPDLFISAREW